MKKIFLLILALVMSGAFSWASEQDALSSQSAVDSALDVAPQWKGTMSQIESATATLLETNRKLEEENAALNAEIAAIDAERLALESQNAQLLQSIKDRQSGGGEPAELVRIRQELSEVNRQITQNRNEFAAAKLRAQSIDSRLSLRQLALKDLEIEKRAVDLDAKIPADQQPGALEAEVKDLQARLESLRGQEKDIRDRMVAENVVAQGVEQKICGTDNTAKLKAELAMLEKQKAKLLNESAVKPDARVDDAQEKSYTDMMARKQQLDQEIAQLQVHKRDLQDAAASMSEPAAETSSLISALEEQNKLLEEQAANLRENIAILQYKINTLERYKNRGHPSR